MVGAFRVDLVDLGLFTLHVRETTTTPKGEKIDDFFLFWGGGVCEFVKVYAPFACRFTRTVADSFLKTHTHTHAF